MHAVTMFIPLVNVSASMGGTEFEMFSNQDIDRAEYECGARTETVCVEPTVGSIVLWDFRTFHRGLPNSADSWRPCLYASVGVPWFDDHNLIDEEVSLFATNAASTRFFTNFFE